MARILILLLILTFSGCATTNEYVSIPAATGTDLVYADDQHDKFKIVEYRGHDCIVVFFPVSKREFYHSARCRACGGIGDRQIH
jgi:hypothetical protein